VNLDEIVAEGQERIEGAHAEIWDVELRRPRRSDENAAAKRRGEYRRRQRRLYPVERSIK
jgi:uncharacterized protein VirK/YbjX